MFHGREALGSIENGVRYFLPHKSGKIWYNTRHKNESLRSTHRLACLKPGKFNVCAKRSGECAWLGAFLFRGLHRAFPGPQTKHGRRLRPLSLPVNGMRAKERTVAGKSEKLAQERLCGNRDRFVVGKRIGSRVWKVSHDLKGVRGLSRFLHRRERAGDYRFGSQHQCQTDRWVGMVSNFNNPETACALESPPSTVKGKYKVKGDAR